MAGQVTLILQFHLECSEARAQGYRDAGICNVERLECTTAPADEPEADVGRRPRGDDPEHSVGP